MRLERYLGRADLPVEMPVFPLAGALLLPHWQLQLNIFEPRYLAMVDFALSGERMIGMIQPADGDSAYPGLVKTGCAGRIVRYVETTDNRYEITLGGVIRFDVDQEHQTDLPFRIIRPDYDLYLGDLVPTSAQQMPDREALLAVLRAYMNVNAMQIRWDAIESADTETIVNALACGCKFTNAERQALLEAEDLLARADILMMLLRMDISGGETGNMQ